MERHGLAEPEGVMSEFVTGMVDQAAWLKSWADLEAEDTESTFSSWDFCSIFSSGFERFGGHRRGLGQAVDDFEGEAQGEVRLDRSGHLKRRRGWFRQGVLENGTQGTEGTDETNDVKGDGVLAAQGTPKVNDWVATARQQGLRHPAPILRFMDAGGVTGDDGKQGRVVVEWRVKVPKGSVAGLRRFF